MPWLKSKLDFVKSQNLLPFDVNNLTRIVALLLWTWQTVVLTIVTLTYCDKSVYPLMSLTDSSFNLEFKLEIAWQCTVYQKDIVCVLDMATYHTLSEF